MSRFADDWNEAVIVRPEHQRPAPKGETSATTKDNEHPSPNTSDEQE